MRPASGQHAIADRARGWLPRALLLAAWLIAISLLASGCGGGSPNRSGSRPSEAQVRKQFVAFAVCMRSHGVPGYPDPQVSMASDGVRVRLSPGPANPNTPAFKSADQACGTLLPNGGLGSGATASSPHEHAQALAFADCMRSHGVPDFPDADRNEDFNLPSEINQQAPQFQHAMQACAKIKPASLVINQS